jgi:mono/diheme cytochrome c family protein|tara:strand:+ start:113 stop:547 length:435 start_codon:yes stop_codon:yes gene_type:complete
MKFNICKHVLVLLWVAVLPHVLVSAQGSNSIWDGIYTDAQAERGAEEYATRCASCHAADLRGDSNSPSLLGMSFMFIWEGRTLGELFRRISTEMPTDQPGSLSAQSYAAILAFILRSNEFPAGNTELASTEAALNAIAITSSAN